jgi:two-component system cell cycle response regulator DivK
VSAHVLVVEDDPLSQRLMRDVLQVHGYDVLVAGTAEEGLDSARTRRPDLVLMDIRLPGMDGFAALDALRAAGETASVPVLAVTASVMLGEREKILNAGFDGYHPKPIQIPQLLAEVAHFVATGRKSGA